MRTPHRWRAAAFVALLGTMASGSAAAQESPPGDVLARIRALGTPHSTDRITVYFDRGHEPKALRLRTLVQEALRFFSDSLGASPDLSLAVLEREAWEKVITWQPYGIPGVAGTPPVAFIPATDDNLAADDALSLEGKISAESRALVAAAGMTWAEGSRRYVDLVGLHELGHAFAQAYGITVKSLWFHEWLATYFCYSYLRAAYPAQAQLWSGILQGYREAVQPEHRTIDAFERLYFGVGAQNYVWYQSRFQEEVARVHEARGVDFLRDLRRAFPPGAPPVRSQEELLERLDQLSPGFRTWAAGMR